MQDLKFPINFTFNVTTLAKDFSAVDATGNEVAYVRQKMFKLKEDIQVFNDKSKTKVNYSIKADRWLDFSASYSFSNSDGSELGKVVRKGWKSIWKADYQIVDQDGKIQYHIREENPWIKVLDYGVSQIPVLAMFTGYFLNPSYIIKSLDGEQIVRLKKEPSLFGRKFSVNKLNNIDNDDDNRIIMLSTMMLLLLERRRG